MRPLWRITLVMRAAHSFTCEYSRLFGAPRFGTWSRSGNSLSRQNCEGGYRPAG
jgi:hypothetical protein